MRNTILHSDNFPAKDFKMAKARAFGTIVMGQIPHNTENKGTLNLEPRFVVCQKNLEIYELKLQFKLESVHCVEFSIQNQFDGNAKILQL